MAPHELPRPELTAPGDDLLLERLMAGLLKQRPGQPPEEVANCHGFEDLIVGHPTRPDVQQPAIACDVGEAERGHPEWAAWAHEHPERPRAADHLPTRALPRAAAPGPIGRQPEQR